MDRLGFYLMLVNDMIASSTDRHPSTPYSASSHQASKNNQHGVPRTLDTPAPALDGRQSDTSEALQPSVQANCLPWENWIEVEAFRCAFRSLGRPYVSGAKVGAGACLTLLRSENRS